MLLVQNNEKISPKHYFISKYVQGSDVQGATPKLKIVKLMWHIWKMQNYCLFWLCMCPFCLYSPPILQPFVWNIQTMWMWWYMHITYYHNPKKCLQQKLKPAPTPSTLRGCVELSTKIPPTTWTSALCIVTFCICILGLDLWAL